MSGVYVLKLTKEQATELAKQCAEIYDELDRSCRGCYIDGFCPRVSQDPEAAQENEDSQDA